MWKSGGKFWRKYFAFYVWNMQDYQNAENSCMEMITFKENKDFKSSNVKHAPK